MKLLDKKTIVVEKSMERKRDIEEGVKLAKTIDALREASSSEESKLKRLRDSTLKLIKLHIDKLLSTKNNLIDDISKLEEEKKEIFKPLNEEKKSIEEKKVWLSKQEDLVLSREEEVRKDKQDLFDREQLIAKSEKYITRAIEIIKEQNKQSQSNLKESESKLNSITEYIQKVMTDISNREKVLKTKEDTVLYREVDVNNLLQKVQNDQEDIQKEKLHIESQRKALKVAWEVIKNKK